MGQRDLLRGELSVKWRVAAVRILVAGSVLLLCASFLPGQGAGPAKKHENQRDSRVFADDSSQDWITSPLPMQKERARTLMVPPPRPRAPTVPHGGAGALPISIHGTGEPESWAALPGEFEMPAPEPAQPRRGNAMERNQQSDKYAVRRYRKGFLQRLRLSGSWVDGGEESDLGIATWKTAVTLAVPLGSFENLLLVTPSFETSYLEGLPSVPVPDQLYSAGLDLMWRKRWNDRWGSMIAVAPALASDFESSENALRVTGRALATWQWVPERVTLLFGVVYLDRDDVSLLPGLGMIWTPTPDYRFDLVFPRPKLARRIAFLPRTREDWVYLSGALGGRTWAVEREENTPDQLTLRDYRINLGWERIIDGGGGAFAEIGFVFGRELQYEEDPVDLSFDDTFILRAGITY